MSTLREDFLEDLDSVFFDAEEFASEHDLNGTVALCILQYAKNNKPAVNYDGMEQAVLTVYVKAGLIEKPVFHQNFTVDRDLYLVESCKDIMGLLKIELAANDI